MKTFLLTDEPQVIAKAGEQGGVAIAIDVSAWQSEYATGTGGIAVRRPDSQLVPMTVTVDGAMMAAVLPADLLGRPGRYKVQATWVSAGTVLASAEYIYIVLSSEYQDVIREYPGTPSWAKEIYVKAEQITGAIDAAMQAVDVAQGYVVQAESAVEDAESAKDAAEDAQEAAELAQEAAEAAQAGCEAVLDSIPEEYDALARTVEAQGITKADIKGYLLDRITTDDTNYTIVGDDSTGHRWDFSTGAENASTGKYYYGIYVIPDGVTVVGVLGYHYTAAMAAYGFYNGDPQDGGVKVMVEKGLSNSTAMPGIAKIAVPAAATHLVVQLGGGPTTRGVFPFRKGPVCYAPAARYPVFGSVDMGGYMEGGRIKHVVVAGDKIVAGLTYTSRLTKRLWIKSLNSRLDNETGTEVFADIKLLNSDTDMGAYRDRGNDPTGSVLQIAHMAYYLGYLYVALRVGGAPASGYTNVTNSVLAVVKMSDLSTTAWITSTDRFCSVRVYGTKLLVGERAGGFRIYDLTDPAEPVELMHVTDSDVTEFQHGCMFTRSGVDYAAFGCYETGVAVYQIGESSATRKFIWNGHQDLGTGLGVFSVDVSGNYIYATISPLNAQRKVGNRTMGVAVINVNNLNTPVYKGFYPIPEEDRGNWAARVAYSAGTLAASTISDPAPDFVRVNGSWLYVNNEDKGIAVYRLTDLGAPDYAGLIPLEVWPRYFEIYSDMIVAGGEYDFLLGKLGEVRFQGTAIA